MVYNKFDILIHNVKELKSSPAELRRVVSATFPEFSHAPADHIYEDLIESYDLEMFSYSRSLGLSIEEAAYNVGWSAILINDIYMGKGVCLETLLDFAEAELFAIARIKKQHLTALDTSPAKNASVVFLEKVFASQYGPASKLTVDTNLVPEEDRTWHVEVTHVETKDKMSSDEKLIAKALEKKYAKDKSRAEEQGTEEYDED